MFIKNNFDIKNYTTFKIGGKIRKIYFPENLNEFEKVIKDEPNAFVAGNWSNTLVSSYGYSGCVISTSKLDNISIKGTKVTVDAGVKGPKLSQLVCENGLSGFEFLIGFPGSVGGEVFMNAGANGQTISDTLVSAKIFDGENIKILTKDELEFGYRNSICSKNNYKVMQAEFELSKTNVNKIKQKMTEILEFRKLHQPSLVLPNCGSVFKNPSNNSAGKLLDECGVKGLKIGGAKVWENHANFIVNYNNASSDDVLNLIYEMRNRVREKFGINLNPEIYFLGEEELWQKLK